MISSTLLVKETVLLYIYIHICAAYKTVKPKRKQNGKKTCKRNNKRKTTKIRYRHKKGRKSRKTRNSKRYSKKKTITRNNNRIGKD